MKKSAGKKYVNSIFAAPAQRARLQTQDLEPSEVAFGGADAHRMLEPVSWSKVRRTGRYGGTWDVPKS